MKRFVLLVGAMVAVMVAAVPPATAGRPHDQVLCQPGWDVNTSRVKAEFSGGEDFSNPQCDRGGPERAAVRVTLLPSSGGTGVYLSTGAYVTDRCEWWGRVPPISACIEYPDRIGVYDGPSIRVPGVPDPGGA